MSSRSKHWYWLRDIDLNGATTLHDPVSATMQGPTVVVLVGMEVGISARSGDRTRWLLAAIGVAFSVLVALISS